MLSIYDRIQTIINTIEDINLRQSEEDLKDELDYIVSDLEKIQEIIY